MIFLELVHRQTQLLIQEATAALNQYPAITGINIPDVMRLPIRSHDACQSLLLHTNHVIPHIRAMDRSIEDACAIIEGLVQKGLSSILIISGDMPTNPSQIVHNISALELIKSIKKAFPKLFVYAGFDPYRASFKEELGYAHAKIEAGAQGFFTQPIFDTHLASIVLDQLAPYEVFLGTSPVLTHKSLQYWQVRNHVVFPRQFSIEPEHNWVLAKSMIEVATQANQHVYLMPITCSLTGYIEAVLW